MKVYYERLYERLQARRTLVAARIDELLPAEIAKRAFDVHDADKLAAYREACLAFLDERLETYNPIGIQYTFDRVDTRAVAELEFQLNWYNSRPEFQALVATVRTLAAAGVTDETLPDLADELIREAGAFPDRSIIAAYTAEPALQKLPDYLLACALEEIICARDPTP